MTIKEKLIKAGIEVKNGKIRMKSSGGVTLTDTLANATFFDTEQEANNAASFVMNRDKVTVKPYSDDKYGDGFIAEYTVS